MARGGRTPVRRRYHMKKRMTAMIVAALAVFLGIAAAAETVEVSTAEELMALALNDKEASYVQTADIDLSGVTFVPVGNADEPFRGVYDGGGYTISGGGIAGDGMSALFAHTNGAKIRNVNVRNVRVSAAAYFGGIVAKAAGHTAVSDCTFEGTFVFSDTFTAPAARGGGIVGYAAKDASVEDCRATAKFENAQTQIATDFGGIVGDNAGLVNRCEYYGTLTMTSAKYMLSLGGVVGENSGEVSHSYNHGNLSATVMAESAYAYVGGVVGYQNGGTVTHTLNTASVTGNGNGVYPAYVGGIVGGNRNGLVEISRNNGKLTGNSAYVGGIVGVNFGSEGTAKVVNCLSENTFVSTDSTSGGISGINATSDDVTSAAYLASSLATKSGKAAGVEEHTVGTHAVTDVYVNNVASRTATTAMKTATTYPGYEDPAWLFAQNRLPTLRIADTTENAGSMASEFGTLLYENTFEYYEAGTDAANIVNTCRSPADEVYHAGVFAAEGGLSVRFAATEGLAKNVIAEAGQNGFLKTNGSAGTWYGIVQLSDALTGAGIYTVTADYYVSPACTSAPYFSVSLGDASVLTPKWSETPLWIYEYAVSTTPGQTFDRITYGAANNGGFYGLDNLRIYYQPVITYVNTADETVYTASALGAGSVFYHPDCPVTEDGQIGWSTEKNGRAVSVLTNIAEDITLYPAFGKTCTVTYYGTDDTVVKTETVSEGSGYTVACDIGAFAETADGICRVIGWSREKGGEAITGIVSVTEDVSLYPVTAKIADRYGRYGILQYFDDFEHLAVDTASYTETKADGNAYFGGLYKNATVSSGVATGTFSIGGDANGRYAGVKVPSGAGYAGIMVTDAASGKGVLTVMYDYYHADASQENIQLWVNAGTAGVTTPYRYNWVRDAVYSLAEGVSLGRFGVGSAWYWGGSTYHDNIRIYYAPLVSYADHEGNIVSSSVVYEGLGAYEPDGEYGEDVGGFRQLGWTTEQGGTQVMTSVSLTGDTVFYPVYGQAIEVRYYAPDGSVLYRETVETGKDYAVTYPVLSGFIASDGKVTRQTGWSCEKGGEAVSLIAGVTGDVDLYPVTEAPVADQYSQYGVLQYFDNFEHLAVDTASYTETKAGGNAYFGGLYENATVSSGVATGTFSISGDVNGRYAGAKVPSGAGYAGITVTGAASGKGVFTVMYDYYHADASQENIQLWVNSGTAGVSTPYRYNWVRDAVYSFAEGVPIDRFGVGSAWYWGGSTYHDNIRIYYAPVVSYADANGMTVQTELTCGGDYTVRTDNYLNGSQIGWALTKDAETPVTTLFALADDAVLYPVFGAPVYAVTFVSEGVTLTEYSASVAEGASVTNIPGAPVSSDESKVFDHWAVNDVEVDPATYEIKADTTFTAVFRTKTYAVTFISEGTELTAYAATVSHGASVTNIPGAPVSSDESKVFDHWAVNDVEVDPATYEIKADTTFTAVFRIKTYAVTFISEGAELTAYAATVSHGASVTNIPDAPVSSDESKVFDHWAVNDIKVDPATYEIKADTTFTAVFRTKTYAVTFISEGAELTAYAATVSHGASVTNIPGAPVSSDESKVFDHWAVNDEEVDPATYAIKADTTFTAVFRDIPWMGARIAQSDCVVTLKNIPASSQLIVAFYRDGRLLSAKMRLTGASQTETFAVAAQADTVRVFLFENAETVRPFLASLTVAP